MDILVILSPLLAWWGELAAGGWLPEIEQERGRGPGEGCLEVSSLPPPCRPETEEVGSDVDGISPTTGQRIFWSKNFDPTNFGGRDG